jgi:DnaK suppressor protein
MIGKVFIRKMKKALLEQKEEILRQVAQINKDEIIDSDGDDTDAIQAKILAETARQLQLRNVNKLKQIDEALIKIEHNTFGLCLDCEEQIPEKRLQFNACVQTCVGCAEARELELKQRKR